MVMHFLIGTVQGRIAAEEAAQTFIEGQLKGNLERIRQGRLMPSLDLTKLLERRINLLEKQVESLQSEIAYMQPKKARSPGDWTFRVRGWEYIDMLVYPHDAPEGKTIRALRIHVPPEDLPDGPPYWDVVRKREIAVLEPMLPHLKDTDTRVHIIQEGDGPRSSYQISFHPPASPGRGGG